MKKTKNILLGVSGVIAITLLYVNNVGIYKMCGAGDIPNQCVEILATTTTLLLIILSVFFFSLVTYFLRDEVFAMWFGFTKWWVPMTIFLILIASSDGGGSIGISFGSPQELTNILLTGLYVIISVLIIIVKSIQVYRKK